MSGALDSAAGAVRWQADPARPRPDGRDRPARPRVFPIVSNAHDEVWDTAAADGALLNARAGNAFIAALAAKAKAERYAGYVLDFENLSPAGATAYAPLLAKLRQALKPQGRELWVTATLAADPALVHALEGATDGVVLMAYDQCWANSTPGPIAGQDWLERTLDAKLAGVDPSHYLVALGAYGYDWPQRRARHGDLRPRRRRARQGQGPGRRPASARPPIRTSATPPPMVVATPSGISTPRPSGPSAPPPKPATPAASPSGGSGWRTPRSGPRPRRPTAIAPAPAPPRTALRDPAPLVGRRLRPATDRVEWIA